MFEISHNKKKVFKSQVFGIPFQGKTLYPILLQDKPWLVIQWPDLVAGGPSLPPALCLGLLSLPHPVQDCEHLLGRNGALFTLELTSLSHPPTHHKPSECWLKTHTKLHLK